MKQKILVLVKKFNEVIRDTISGPDCLDLDVCLGECCFVQIPVPKCLASYYINQGWAEKSFFKRSSEFAFVMAVDLASLRCKFFDKALNGCSLHNSGYKAPQCWVYPTGLDNEEVNPTCKKVSGWAVKNGKRLKEAKQILKEYVQACKMEAIFENSKDQITIRLNSGSLNQARKLAPHQIAGIQDSWDEFHILTGEGFSMGMKQFCDQHQCSQPYFQCEQVCDAVFVQFRNFFEQRLPKFIAEYGFRQDYSIFALKKIAI